MGESPHSSLGDDFSAFELNVWASLSDIEGHLQAINTYDTAFLSVGPLQQTAGARDFKGELFGAMATVREEAPDVFEQLIGRHGLNLRETAMELGARKAYAQIDGELLNDGESKERLRDFKWAYRVSNAFDEPDFREHMLREGLRRIENVRDEAVELTVEAKNEEQQVETTIGEVFRSDLAMALFIDTHVNAPALVWPNANANIWREPFEELLSRWEVTNPQEITREREMQLIAQFLEERLGEGDDYVMTDPVNRAIKILKYTDTHVVEDLAQADASQRGILDARVTSFLAFRLELSEEEARDQWRAIQAFPRKTLSLST